MTVLIKHHKIIEIWQQQKIHIKSHGQSPHNSIIQPILYFSGDVNNCPSTPDGS